MNTESNASPALPETAFLDQLDACFYQVVIFRSTKLLWPQEEGSDGRQPVTTP